MEIRINTTEIGAKLRKQWEYLKEEVLLRSRPDDIVYKTVPSIMGLGDTFHVIGLTRKEWSETERGVFSLRCEDAVSRVGHAPHTRMTCTRTTGTELGFKFRLRKSGESKPLQWQ